MEQRMNNMQSLSQKMRMSSVMLRSLSLLNYPQLTLREEILKEVKENPALDIESEPQLTSLDDLEKNAYNSRFLRTTERKSQTNAIEALLESPLTLSDHLIWQLYMENITESEKQIGKTIIENLDSRGFLKDDPFFLCNRISGSNARKIRRVLKIIQQLTPAGCAVWNESESIIVQANLLNIDEESKIEIYRFCKKLHSIHLTDKEEQALVKMFRKNKKLQAILQKINPYPGSAFKHEPHNISDSIFPDATVSIKDGKILIRVNNDLVPTLAISEEIGYLSRYVKEKNVSKIVNQMIYKAEKFMDGIQYREQALEKIVNHIVNVQKDYFLSRTEELVQLTQKEIAEELGLHESTISRIVSQKYIETPRGIFELQSFVTQRSAVMQSKTKKILNNLLKILQENKKNKRISDRKLSELLEKKGIVLARRTVAKYRKIFENWEKKQKKTAPCD